MSDKAIHRCNTATPTETEDPSAEDYDSVKQGLRVLAADADSASCDFYHDTLSRLGHQLCMARSGRQLIDLSSHFFPDLVITEDRVDDLEVETLTEELWRVNPTPIIWVANGDHAKVNPLVGHLHIQAFLTKPLKEMDLELAIPAAVQRFEELQSLRQEVAHLRQALEERKVIERAKGMIMKYANLNEEEAFQRLQRLACVQNQKLIHAARAVVDAGSLLKEIGA